MVFRQDKKAAVITSVLAALFSVISFFRTTNGNPAAFFLENRLLCEYIRGIRSKQKYAAFHSGYGLAKFR